MKAAALVAFLGLALTEAAQQKGQVTPITKVLSMLQAMHGQAKKEIHDEQINFSAYKQWCEDTAGQKARLIAEANSKVDSLTADIGKFLADAERLGKEIQGHDADVSSWNQDVTDSTAIRDAERKDFQATHKDYSESIDALQRAISTLKKEAYNRPQAAALLQRLSQSGLMPFEARSRLAAFLDETDPQGLNYKAPVANSYEFQSTSIVDMLQKLLDKFEDERTALEKSETNAQHSFELLVQDLKASIEQATQLRNGKATEKANKEQSAATSKASLEATSNARKSDSSYLADLTSQCQTKNQEFQTRQKLRTEEIEALSKAVEVLSTTVTPNAEKYLPGGASFLQRAKAVKGVSLIQAASNSKARDVQHKLALFLREKAEKLHSKILSALAVKVEEDPFVKVKKMIQDLVFRLEEEANQEAEHKGWCDTELKTNDLSRKHHTQHVAELTSNIDNLSAEINILAQEITDLSKALTDLDAAVSKATEQRNTENAQNTQTIKDSQDAQTAVAQALTILKEFYAKSGAPALVQTPKEDAPISWETPYTGQLGSKGVVDMLEVIQSDFARLETETRADEATAAKAYTDFMNESALNKVAMQKDVEFKSDKKQEKTSKKEQTTEDLTSAQKELDAANAYFEKLKPACLDAGTTYEDRVARRKDEIESLRQALEILSGDFNVGPALVQTKQNIRRHVA